DRISCARVPHSFPACVPSVLATDSFHDQAVVLFDGSSDIEEVSPHRCSPIFGSKSLVSSNELVNGLIRAGNASGGSLAMRVASSWRTNVCPQALPCGSLDVQLSHASSLLDTAIEALKSSEQASLTTEPAWIVARVEVS